MIKAILFDFDGVLVDSRQATIEYFQDSLRHFKLPVPPVSAFKNLLGLKTIDILKGLLPQMSDKELEPVFTYSKDMSIKAVPKITLVPHALEVLSELKKKYKLALITSRGKVSVEILFKQYGLGNYFSVVLDREDVTKHKPDPEGILRAMKELGVNEKAAIYIGDNKEDILAAHNAKISCVYISEKTNDFGSDYHISEIEKLPYLIKQINASYDK